MGIDAQLRGEDGEVLAEAGDPQMVLSRATGSQLFSTRLLRYLVPWGDAIFNQAQANDLANDIAKVKGECPGSPLFKALSEIEPLVERLANESHLYLWFVGD
ncbi:MAG: hypothetical protein WCK86_02255 [Planctomycetia bacterium]